MPDRSAFSFIFVLDILLGTVVGRRKKTVCMGMANAPLPCPRDLWDYESKFSWAYRRQEYVRSRTGQDVLRIRDLQNACNSCTNLDIPSRDNQTFGRVANWCGSLDNLGTLVYMAALLDS
jgi:hypothetical protein